MLILCSVIVPVSDMCKVNRKAATAFWHRLVREVVAQRWAETRQRDRLRLRRPYFHRRRRRYFGGRLEDREDSRTE